jgi:hypothetical protein
MAKNHPSQRTLGQQLVSQLNRELIDSYSQACMLFINQVSIEAIPAELEAMPTTFRCELEKFIASLGINSPEWDGCFLIGSIDYFGTMNSEEHAALLKGIVKKNRMTAEELGRYFQAHRVNT